MVSAENQRIGWHQEENTLLISHVPSSCTSYAVSPVLTLIHRSWYYRHLQFLPEKGSERFLGLRTDAQLDHRGASTEPQHVRLWRLVLSTRHIASPCLYKYSNAA